MDTSDEQMSTAFGSIFLMAQRWQTLGNIFLRRWGLTTKQWLLLATMEMQLGGSATLGDAAAAYRSSYQNVKRIAQNLEQEGFIKLTKDPEDRRVLRLTITEKNRRFWEQHDTEALEYIKRFFQDLTDGEIREFVRMLQVLLNRTEQISAEVKQD